MKLAGQNVMPIKQWHWEVHGQGQDLVLLHGWGMNAGVWESVLPYLTPYFTVHLVDLAGYGYSAEYDVVSLENLVQELLAQAPSKAAWLGWSLGGMIASEIARHFPERVSHLITLASSPCFVEQPQWAGVAPKVLAAFQQQLATDFQATISQFLALQTLGSPSARQDSKQLKQAVLSRPTPALKALTLGLEILEKIDLRPQLNQIQCPFLHLYGRLDALVPVSIAQQVQTLAPHSTYVIFQHSAHAPFISEPEIFTAQLRQFITSYQ